MASLTPPNASALMRTVDAVTAARLGAIAVPVATVGTPSDCPAALLPWLAWAWAVEEWSSTWSEEQQRAAIAASRTVHRIKGTPAAVAAAIAPMGYTASVIDWHQQSPQGAPYTYDLALTLTQTGLSPYQYQRLLSLIDRAKPARAHLADVYITLQSDQTAYVCAHTVIDHTITIRP